MSSPVEQIIERNWEEVKNEMRKTWRNLTDDQVGKINTYNDLVKELKKAYDIVDDDKISDKINKFIEKLDLQPNFTRFEEFKNSLYEGASDAKNKMEKIIKSSAEDLREKTNAWSCSAIKYTKEHPLKVFGFTVIAAFVVKKIISKK